MENLEEIVFQPSIFRGYIGFRECITRQNDAPHYCILIVVSLYCEYWMVAVVSALFESRKSDIHYMSVFFQPISLRISMLPIRMSVFNTRITMLTWRNLAVLISMSYSIQRPQCLTLQGWNITWPAWQVLLLKAGGLPRLCFLENMKKIGI